MGYARIFARDSGSNRSPELQFFCNLRIQQSDLSSKETNELPNVNKGKLRAGSVATRSFDPQRCQDTRPAGRLSPGAGPGISYWSNIDTRNGIDYFLRDLELIND